MGIIDFGLWFTDPAYPDGPRRAVNGWSVFALK